MVDDFSSFFSFDDFSRKLKAFPCMNQLKNEELTTRRSSLFFRPETQPREKYQKLSEMEPRWTKMTILGFGPRILGSIFKDFQTYIDCIPTWSFSSGDYKRVVFEVSRGHLTPNWGQNLINFKPDNFYIKMKLLVMWLRNSCSQSHLTQDWEYLWWFWVKIQISRLADSSEARD